jgi:glycosyltransferase involved in cell wall biosynthesis
MEQEWQAADLVWVPASGLIDVSRECGADPLKFHVIPYPIAGRVPIIESKEFARNQPLRVIFAGTLCLRKGVQYIYEALRRRPDIPVDMHFFGQGELTPLGLSRLAEVGTVHGAIPRSQLIDEFRKADVLLFPSLSEGSALVTLEATGVGVPVIATEETGAPASAITIPSRDPGAIISALESLIDDRTLLSKISEAGLAEAGTRDYAAYAAGIAESFATLTASQ